MAFAEKMMETRLASQKTIQPKLPPQTRIARPCRSPKAP
jgi:hypothetical protein